MSGMLIDKGPSEPIPQQDPNQTYPDKALQESLRHVTQLSAEQIAIIGKLAGLTSPDRPHSQR